VILHWRYIAEALTDSGLRRFQARNRYKTAPPQLGYDGTEHYPGTYAPRKFKRYGIFTFGVNGSAKLPRLFAKNSRIG
jgi:hypothetical protein